MSKMLSLTQPFIDKMNSLGWPKRDVLHRYYAFTNQHYSDLRQGLPVPCEFVEGFMSFVLCRNPQFHGRDAASLVAEFTVAVQLRNEDFPSQADPLTIGASRGSLPVLQTGRAYDIVRRTNRRCLCRSDRDLRLLEEIDAATVLRHLGCNPANLRGAKCQQIVKEFYRPFGGYSVCRDAVTRWLRANPLTTMFAVSAGQIVGASTVLPLSRSAYHSLRDGSFCSIDVSEDDILEKSRYLLLESVGEADAAFRNPRRAFRAITMTLFYQMAMLLDEAVNGTPEMLSFFATPVNQKRLQRHGFIATGTFMPKSNWGICELRAPKGIWNRNHFFYWPIIGVLRAIRGYHGLE